MNKFIRQNRQNNRQEREFSQDKYSNKKHFKNVGPIRYCEPPLHCQSPGVAIAQAACDVHDNNNNNNNDNA